MRHIFVINPVAGKMDPAQLLTPPIKAAAADHPEEEVEIYITKEVGDACTFVRSTCEAYEKPVRFYACGGDGTLNEVVNGMVGFSQAELGLIPCGSGNDFVKNYPNRDFFHISAQLESKAHPIDLLKVNDRYSINITNIGLDSDAADYMTRFKRLPLVNGKMAYNLGLVYSVCLPIGHDMKITLDDGETVLQDRYMLAVAANGQYYGGHFRCAPLAALDDGLIDICLVKKISRLRIPALLSVYENGRHVDDEKLKDIISYHKCRKMVIEADHPISLARDGEIDHASRIEIELLPGALNCSVPERQAGAFSQRLAKAQKGDNFGG
ncbi:MAG: diacylglycerol kinase family lipid kinase [Oscillospiraceae bacterium]|nr:diacylglycerol kinase family lipid kinase [Oscillospiraceae bacterium]